MPITPSDDIRFYVCTENRVTGKISEKVTHRPMTYRECLDHIERSVFLSHGWRNLTVGIQPVNHPYFTSQKGPSA